MISALIVLILTSISCGLIGIYLVSRKISMLTDAISHTVLLGIVLMFLIVRDLSSPFLLIGAALMGAITVVLVEILGAKNKIGHENAIGVVYPILFSLAVILVSKFLKNVHLDLDIVLIGEVIFSSLQKINILGIEISKNVFQSLIVLLVVIAYILLFYNELKISTFDRDYAIMSGVKVKLVYYSLMLLTSFVAVSSFDSVGGILVISFFIAPAATALLLTKRLGVTILNVVMISIINCLIGYLISIKLNVSMSGTIAFINLLNYCIIIIYNKLRYR